MYISTNMPKTPDNISNQISSSILNPNCIKGCKEIVAELPIQESQSSSHNDCCNNQFMFCFHNPLTC